MSATPNGQFVQIAVSPHNEDHVYALDNYGLVWWFDETEGLWKQMSSIRIAEGTYKPKGEAKCQ